MKIHLSSVANLFFEVGSYLILLEAFFFNFCRSLAYSPYWVRSFIGFNFYPSEIWFIGLGNIIVFLLLMQKNLNIPKCIVADSKPIFVIIGVYFFSFIYGLYRGNPFAMQDVREMIFSALGLPVILWLSPYINIEKIFKRLVSIFLLVILVWSLIAVRERLLLIVDESRIAHSALLVIATFFLSYYLLASSLLSRYYILSVFLVSFAFVAFFSKVSLALFMFSSMVSLSFSAYLNPSSRNLILSKYKVKIVFFVFLFFVVILLGAVLVNSYTGGAIEGIYRYTFLKERLATSGDIHYGDVTGGRFAIWSASLDAWAMKPFFGYGMGSTVEAYSSGWREKSQFHNYFFQTLHHTGLVGIIFILGGWLFWWRRVLRKLRCLQDTYSKIVFASMAVYVLCIMFYGLFGHPLSYPPDAQFFWLCVGFLSVFNPSFLYRKKDEADRCQERFGSLS